MLSKYTYSSALFKKSFPHAATGSSCLLRAVKKRQHPKMLLSVRAKGLEPIRTRHQILSLAWLPITTRPHFPMICKDIKNHGISYMWASISLWSAFRNFVRHLRFNDGETFFSNMKQVIF